MSLSSKTPTRTSSSAREFPRACMAPTRVIVLSGGCLFCSCGWFFRMNRRKKSRLRAPPQAQGLPGVRLWNRTACSGTDRIADLCSRAAGAVGGAAAGAGPEPWHQVCTRQPCTHREQGNQLHLGLDVKNYWFYCSLNEMGSVQEASLLPTPV